LGRLLAKFGNQSLFWQVKRDWPYPPEDMQRVGRRPSAKLLRMPFKRGRTWPRDGLIWPKTGSASTALSRRAPASR
jgi:hypothetical protein